MNIDRLGTNDAAIPYRSSFSIQRPTTSGPESTSAPSGADQVSVSDEARALASARDVVAQVPDVRAEKVAAVKQRVEDGTYSVPASVLARNILSQGVGGFYS